MFFCLHQCCISVGWGKKANRRLISTQQSLVKVRLRRSDNAPEPFSRVHLTPLLRKDQTLQRAAVGRVCWCLTRDGTAVGHRFLHMLDTGKLVLSAPSCPGMQCALRRPLQHQCSVAEPDHYFCAAEVRLQSSPEKSAYPSFPSSLLSRLLRVPATLGGAQRWLRRLNMIALSWLHATDRELQKLLEKLLCLPVFPGHATLLLLACDRQHVMAAVFLSHVPATWPA